MFGATFSFPLLMGRYLCIEGDTVGMSQLIGTVVFVAGLSTLIQTTFGVRSGRHNLCDLQQSDEHKLTHSHIQGQWSTTCIAGRTYTVSQMVVAIKALS